ncbi:cysteine--tRNA ligase, partial [bacterium]|nr:cysteine--tRNA ligase [bacterium]
MDIWIYDTLEAKKKKFEPLNGSVVTFYACGVTVYDYCHIGHARVYVTTDCIRRVLAYAGYSVRYIQNFTDIDDKIINRANEAGVTVDQLTARYIDAYFEDMDRLGIQRADAYPRATEYVKQMLDLIQRLLDAGNAYQIPSGDVVFSVGTFSNYGKLSKKKLDDLEAGARVDIDSEKRHPGDFVLWKSAKPGEPAWDSPWGKGRPGWHIECSAMAMDELGPTIDIHAGGEDLVFPHHENEICQSECVTGKPFVRYWVHNGFVTIRDEKMSKSLGNFKTLRDVLAEYDGDVVRFFLLKVHYRSP